MAERPDVIAVDAGSSDPGPYYLGAGVSFTDREAVKRDLAIMLTGARAEGIPLIVGTAGGAGAKPHLDWTVDIVREIALEEELSFRLAVIEADIDKRTVLEAIESNRVEPCGSWEEVSKGDVEESVHLVAQMGVEPFVAALGAGAEVILAGRAYDPAVFAALPILRGFDPGLATHLGKILECAAIACDPGSGSDCMFGVLRADDFSVHPLNPDRACTVSSVAAHTLYEKSDPYILHGPGGLLDLTETKFEQQDARTVRVSGSKHIPTPYSIKLEGSSPIGYRTIAIAGVRDPTFIKDADTILESVRARTADNFSALADGDYSLLFRLYGRDGVMGQLEPERERPSHELGIVIEAVATTQEMADTICAFARSTLLHQGFPGRVSTAGNLAFPYSPSDVSMGPVYRFSVYHLMQIEDPECFRTEFEQVGVSAPAGNPQ